MIYINLNPLRTQQIAEKWFDWVTDFVDADGTKAKMLDAIASNVDLTADEKTLGKQIVETFFTCLEYYVMADNTSMKHIVERYAKYGIKKGSKLYKVLKKGFSDMYSDFTQYIPDEETKEVPYLILDELNIRTCPYCNRNYTFSIHRSSGRTRPELDHFYNKAKTPLLAVTFYNLVPSCPTCNKLKLTSTIGINPYFERFTSKFKVTREGSSLPILAEQLNEGDHLVIGFDNPSKEESMNIKHLALNELYQMHEDEVREIVEKAHAYNDHANAALVNSFQGAGESPSEVFEFVWGKNLETSRQINRPLSKLTRDVLQQVGVMPKEDEER